MIHMAQNKSNIRFEVLLALISQSSHGRAIARFLQKPHATIQRALHDLMADNIIDSRLEGKNKVYCLRNNVQAKSSVYAAEMYKLAKAVKTHPSLGVIFEEVQKKVPKGMIVLFGSYAKGTSRKESDIDLFIEANDVKIKKKLENDYSQLKVKLGKFDKSSLLIKEIIKNHVIIRGIEEFYEKRKFFEEALEAR